MNLTFMPDEIELGGLRAVSVAEAELGEERDEFYSNHFWYFFAERFFLKCFCPWKLPGIGYRQWNLLYRR
jgi:hypothetical protein